MSLQNKYSCASHLHNGVCILSCLYWNVAVVKKEHCTQQHSCVGSSRQVAVTLAISRKVNDGSDFNHGMKLRNEQNSAVQSLDTYQKAGTKTTGTRTEDRHKNDLAQNPAHPPTQALVNSIPTSFATRLNAVLKLTL